MRLAEKISCNMTYIEEFVYIGHVATEKDKTSYDLFRRVYIYRSWDMLNRKT